MIYFDNAASTIPYNEVIETMTNIMQTIYGNPSSVHFQGRQAKVIIEKSRKTISNILDVSPSEIFFTSGGTEAINIGLNGIVKDLKVKHIITSPIEHHAVLHTIKNVKKEYNVKVSMVNINEFGDVDLDSLKTLCTETENALVCLMHANNEIGSLLPLNKINEICIETGALFFCDTVQTMGKYLIYPQKQGLDFATCSAHKFHGPKGIGFLYKNNKIQINPMFYGGGQEMKLRPGTENIASIAGMAKAFELSYEKLDQRIEYISQLKNYFAKQLSTNFPEVSFIGNSNNKGLYTILSVAFPFNSKTEMLLYNLDIAEIAASGGSACTSGALGKSHVIEHFGISNKVVIRFSFSKYNTISEIDQCLLILNQLLNN